MKKTNIKRVITFILLVLASSCQTNKQELATKVDNKIPESEYSVFLVADCGRNGSFDQTKIGEVMGVYAEGLEPEYILQCGDMFHYNGVQSIEDPIFMTNFELIYKHGELQCPWWGVLGNHEYRGNTKAVIDYTKKSRRWNLPARYYARTFEGDNDLDSVMVLFMDTCPMINKYHNEEGYPDAREQDVEKQIRWIDSTLEASNAKWKIAIGHHPIYSYSKKSPLESKQMQERVAQIFKKHEVTASFSGHVHTFQHLKAEGEPTEYFVAPSASQGRKHQIGKHTKYATDKTGFIVLGFTNDCINVSMIDANGKMVYTYPIKK